MEAWLNHLKEFFTIFITAPFIFQLFCAALDAVLSVGHLHLQKKHILFQLLWIVVLFASMLLLCMLSNSFDNPTSFAFTPTLVVFSIIIPGVVFIALSGHSKWHNIQAKKGKADAARGKIFTKIGREIAIAVREGGANPESNSKLKDILAEYPQIKERLTEISPKFKMLSTPMGKVMLGKATVADMSEKSGVDIEVLIRKLSEMTGA